MESNADASLERNVTTDTKIWLIKISRIRAEFLLWLKRDEEFRRSEKRKLFRKSLRRRGVSHQARDVSRRRIGENFYLHAVWRVAFIWSRPEGGWGAWMPSSVAISSGLSKRTASEQTRVNRDFNRNWNTISHQASGKPKTANVWRGCCGIIAERFDLSFDSDLLLSDHFLCLGGDEWKMMLIGFAREAWNPHILPSFGERKTIKADFLSHHCYSCCFHKKIVKLQKAIQYYRTSCRDRRWEQEHTCAY